MLALIPVLAVCAYGAVGLFLADLGVYKPLLVLLLGTLAFAGLCVGARPVLRRTAETVGVVSQSCGAAAVAFAVAYATWNAANASEHVQINRDGGLYLNTGKWIADHGNLTVHPFVGAFSAGVVGPQSSTGLTAFGNRLELGLAHMLPALLADMHSVGGDRAMFVTVPILSGLAMLAFYVLAARLTRSAVAALGAMVCLAVLMPQVSFSRDTTTEVPIQVLLFTAIWLLADPRTLRNRSTALCAGIVLGLIQAMHIDGLAFLLGLPVVYAAVWLHARRSERRELRAGIVWSGVGVLGGVALGFFDLSLEDHHYLSQLKGSVERLVAGLVVMFVASAVLIVIARRAELFERLQRARRPASVATFVVALLVGFGAWFVRPLVQTTRVGANPMVRHVQIVNHLTIDAGRRYAEYTVQWLSWYIGPLTLIIGIVVAAVVACTIVKGTARLPVQVAAFVLAPPALLYLYRPSITPDHIWAMRRFLPSAFPALILLVFGVLVAVVRRTDPGSANARKIVAVVVGVAAVAYPLYTIRDLTSMTEQRGEYAAVHQACNIVGKTSAIVLLQDSFSVIWESDPQTLRSFCNVPVVVMLRKNTDATKLRQLAQSWHDNGRRLFVVASFPATINAVLPGLRIRATSFAKNAHLLEQTLIRRPGHFTTESLHFVAAPVPLAG